MLERERWEVDGTRSTLSFVLRHLVISEIQGRFKRWGGELFVDPDHVEQSYVNLWIDLASIDTGSGERDAHLRSPEFLEVERFPRAEFQSTAVALRTDGAATVKGRLRLHGVTEPVEIVVTSQRTWIDDTGLTHAGYVARGQINRQVFGLHWNQDLDVGGFVVGDRVEIEARIEVTRISDARRAPGPQPARVDAR